MSREIRARTLRVTLVLFALVQAVIGGWALFLPHRFYDGFPLPGHAWVAMFPPYNEHLIRDYGGLNLALAFLLAVCALTMARGMIRATAIGYEFYALPHLLFHIVHLEHFPAIDAVGQTASLVLTVLGPLVLLALTRATPPTSEGSTALARFFGQDGGDARDPATGRGGAPSRR